MCSSRLRTSKTPLVDTNREENGAARGGQGVAMEVGDEDGRG